MRIALVAGEERVSLRLVHLFQSEAIVIPASGSFAWFGYPVVEAHFK